MCARSLVTVIDDDESVRESLPDLLRSYGMDAEAFSSAEAFLATDAPQRTACLIVDVAMPGMSGLELQQELTRRKAGIPVIFITAHTYEWIHREALQRGAVACLLKPFSDAALLEALNAALGGGAGA